MIYNKFKDNLKSEMRELWVHLYKFKIDLQIWMLHEQNLEHLVRGQLEIEIRGSSWSTCTNLTLIYISDCSMSKTCAKALLNKK